MSLYWGWLINAVYHKSTDGHYWVPPLSRDWEPQGGWASSSVMVGCVHTQSFARLDMVAYGVAYGVASNSYYSMFHKRWNSTAGWDREWSENWGSFRGDPSLVST